MSCEKLSFLYWKTNTIFFVVFLMINEIVAINKINIVFVIILTLLLFRLDRCWCNNFRWNDDWLRRDDDICRSNDSRWNNDVCRRVRLTTFSNYRDFLLFNQQCQNLFSWSIFFVILDNQCFEFRRNIDVNLIDNMIRIFHIVNNINIL